jgi:polar amino acid transport system substrate-binding protein
MFVAFLVLGCFVAFAQQQPQSQSQPQTSSSSRSKLLVGVKEFKPFVFFESGTVVDAEGRASVRPTGFSIDLFDAIALLADFDVEYRLTDELGTLLNRTAAGVFNASIAGISITEAREAIVDFSQPTYATGIGIMVLGAGTQSVLFAFTSPVFWSAICTVLLLAYFFSVFIWCCEHRDNPAFQPKHFDPAKPWDQGVLFVVFDGMWQALWFTTVTVATIGYGDKTPITSAGRMCTIALMFVGLATFGLTAGTISAELTNAAAPQEIQSAADLAGKNIAVPLGTLDASFVRELNALALPNIKTFDNAVTALAEGEAKAVVFDWPVIVDYLYSNPSAPFSLIPNRYRRHYYGVAFPKLSPLREPVNAALLRLTENGQYDVLLERYFGAADALVSGGASGGGDEVSWSKPSSVWIVILTAIVLVIHMGMLVWLAWKERLIERIEKAKHLSKPTALLSQGRKLMSTLHSKIENITDRAQSDNDEESKTAEEVIIDRLDEMQRTIDEQSHRSRRRRSRAMRRTSR